MINFAKDASNRIAAVVAHVVQNKITCLDLLEKIGDLHDETPCVLAPASIPRPPGVFCPDEHVDCSGWRSDGLPTQEMASVMLQGIKEIDVLWITAGLGCDGDTISITAATQPSIEDLVLGALPGIPKVKFHNPVLAFEAGDEFMSYFHRAAEGQLSPFILVIEGSIPNEQNKDEGYWAALGTDRQTGQPILTCDWIDRLAGRAWAVVAAGTCATYGGIHAMQGNPTGCMGLADYLGRDWKSSAGIPIVNVPGCPVLPDNFMEVLLYLLYHAAGLAPLIPLDEVLRPTWLFGQTVHESCDRGGYYEQGDFAETYGSPQCIVKLGCWGPVVNCNVGKRGWINGIGGCPNVGGICIGCTMPGFPDKFMPFMNQPPGSLLSSHAVATYGRAIKTLRKFTQNSLNKVPEWRRPAPNLDKSLSSSKKTHSHADE